MATRTIKKSATKKRATGKKTGSKAPVKKSATRKKTANKNIKSKSSQQKNPGSKFCLNSVLAINDVKRLYAELSKVLNAKKSISIDASAVEMVDTAILQLLLAFIKKAQLQNTAVAWVKPSIEFLNRAEMLNLTDILGLKEAL